MTQLTDLDSTKARRRERRDFIRAHHPDVGGTHDDFIRGLAAFDVAQRFPPTSTTPVTVIPRSTWPVSLTTVVLRRLRRRYQAPRVR
jgi:hypothetical protein